MKAELTTITEEMIDDKKEFAEALNKNFNALNDKMHYGHEMLLQKFEDTEKSIREIKKDMKATRSNIGTINTNISIISNNINLILNYLEIPGGKKILEG
jgi:hypothetical protein